jgi:uncharacterized membrane protein (UPF0127 family)
MSGSRKQPLARITKTNRATIDCGVWTTRHFVPHPIALSLAVCWILIFGGCQPKVAQTTPFGLRVAELKVSNVSVRAEIADTPQASENGLMFRDSLPEDHGMLFIFEEPKKATFWMKNTKIPLSIAYIDSAGKILEIKSMNPLDETVVPSSSDVVAYALEVNQGWFARHGILTGAKIDGIPRK